MSPYGFNPAPDLPAEGLDDDALRSFMQQNQGVLDELFPQQAVPPQYGPDARIGPIRLPGSGLDAASMAILQQMQNAPRPRNFGHGLAQGFIGGLAGVRAGDVATRQKEYEQVKQQNEAAEKSKRTAAASLLATYRHQQLQAAREAQRPTRTQSFRLTPQEAAAMGPGYDTATEYPANVKNEAMQRMRPQQPSSIDAGFSPDDVASGIVEGSLAAHPSGYARGQWGKIATSIRKKFPKFNLAKAQMYWAATQRMLSTVNGTRFSLMMNASNTLDSQLELMDNASATLESLLPRSKWDSLNSLTVDKLAREMGVNGQQIKSAAQAYYTQASLMQSELAQVFQAGGVPTEEAMKMAQRALPLDANFATIHKLINVRDGLVRQDLRLRQNAIKTFSPIIPGQNPYWDGEEGGGEPIPTPMPTPTNPTGVVFLNKGEKRKRGNKP